MEIINRKASFNYFITDTIEAGIALKGTEIKSLRKGSADLKDTYVRIKSVLDKVNSIPKFNEIKIENLQDEYSQNIIDIVSNFEDILLQVINKSEPSFLAKYLIELSKAFSSFYNENKIICDDKSVQDARLYLSFVVGKVLKQGANLLGITMPDKM